MNRNQFLYDSVIRHKNNKPKLSHLDDKIQQSNKTKKALIKHPQIEHHSKYKNINFSVRSRSVGCKVRYDTPRYPIDLKALKKAIDIDNSEL